jgi:hypothetical protein
MGTLVWATCPLERGVRMRSKWTQAFVARCVMSAGTIAAVAAVVGAGQKWR